MSFEFIIVGLGNPGPQYQRTRHNAGAALVEEIASRHRISLTGLKYRSLTGLGSVAGRRCLLALPQTYMNLSGQAVRRMLSYTSTPAANLVVAHDDLDLPLGRLRLRRGGGCGGHRGVESIMHSLDGQDFMRVRIGIGRPAPSVPADRYVLSRFSGEQKPAFEESLQRAVLAVETILTAGLAKAMSLYNTSPAGDEGPENQLPPP